MPTLCHVILSKHHHRKPCDISKHRLYMIIYNSKHCLQINVIMQDLETSPQDTLGPGQAMNLFQLEWNEKA